MMKKGGIDFRIELKSKDFLIDSTFNVQIQEITFKITNKKPYGYIVKVEK